MTTWLKDIAQWHIGNTLYLSVPFTWLLPEARRLILAYKTAFSRGHVQVGGPAAQLMPDYLADLADIAAVNQPCPVEPLLFHNPLATFTSRGCPNCCDFCAVSRLEGGFRELSDWRPAPIVCDNNLLAASRAHFDRVIDRLKSMPFVDFNQGLEARLLTPYHAWRLAELRQVKIRFAFDHVGMEGAVADALSLCRAHGLKDFGVYVLIGFTDTPEDARHRLDTVREWGIRPNPMRYQPLDALSKNQYLASGWTEKQMKDTVRYYSRLRWLENVPFEEYGRLEMPLLEAL